MADGTGPVPVLCFPPAGAGASFFHAWRAGSPRLRICPVELPGRERRFAEPPHTDLRQLAGQLAGEVAGQVGTADRVLFFGHSLGAVLAYETVRALAAAGTLTGRQAALVVSGSAAPGIPRPYPLSGRPDDAFLDGFRRIVGGDHPALDHPALDHPALDDPELRELVLPVLRADVQMHESYRPVPGEPLAIPVVCLRGAQDPLVTPDGADRWAGVTTGRFVRHELPGEHMFLVPAWRSVLELIETVHVAEGTRV